jgi:hypothetical protein
MVKSLDKQHTDVTAFVDEETASGPSDDRHMEEEFKADLFVDLLLFFVRCVLDLITKKI